MEGLTREERRRFGALLEQRSQAEVMARISQFSQAEPFGFAPPPPEPAEALGVLVFNMERGVHLGALGDFLERCPEVRPFDVILANELDDGCVRSGGRHTARELARRLELNGAFGLEFVELVNPEDPKGFHGNAIFSRWPLRWARVVRLPEAYNWYFDRQRRIGGRVAVLAELDVGGKPLGVGTLHLENRTHGPGRQAQLEAVLEAADAWFAPETPVVLGGDLNTNTFDGRDKDAIQAIAASPALRRRCLEDVGLWEGSLPAAEARGYRLLPEIPAETRRKPLPGGGWLGLRLDWLLVRGLAAGESRTVSTRKEDWTFCGLESFPGPELSDHNAVWASLVWPR